MLLLFLTSLPLFAALGFFALVVTTIIAIIRRSLIDGIKIFSGLMLILLSSLVGALGGISTAESWVRITEISTDIPHPSALIMGAVVGAIFGSTILWAMFAHKNSRIVG